MPKDPRLGSYIRTFAGRVNNDEYLAGSSSGGLTSWLVSELLEAKMVDAVINVGRPGPTDREIVGYGVSETGGAAERRKSHYYATTMADVLQAVEGSNLRYVIVGIPCYIKAARALCVERPELAARLVFFVGLVCGHFKTQAFGESLAWQLGVLPSELVDVDFRIKDPTRPPNEYHFGARRNGEEKWRHKPTRELIGGNWGHNAFQPEACNFCDDVLAETADVSFGDAWLPQFTADSRGTNIVVCRNNDLDVMFDKGGTLGQITVVPLSADDVAQSQGGGLRHRRDGLALRLADDIAAGLSVPKKRVEPDPNAVSSRRADLLRQRRRMAARSHSAYNEAVAVGDLNIYMRAMLEEISRYRKLDAPLAVRILRESKRLAVALPVQVNRLRLRVFGA